MMQGDACAFGIQIINSGGSPVTPEDIQDLEITLGRLRKTYRNTQLFYEGGLWFFPLSQFETLSLRPAPQQAQVRVHWRNGVVEGQPIYGFCISESQSREVL